MITPRSFLYSHPLPTPPSSPTKQQSSVVLRRRDDRFAKNSISVSSSPVLSNAAAAATDMATPKDSGSLFPSKRGPPSASVTNAARPTTPTSAVQIPVKSKQEAAYMRQSRHHADSRRWYNGHGAGHKRRPKHSPDSIPAPVAELLALTSIPNRRPPRRRQSKDSRMTVDSIISQSQVSEKELSQELGLSPLSRSPMDVLLSPPEDLLDDDESVTSDSGFTSAFSTREGSFESLPSLGDSFGTSLLSPSVNSPATPRSRQSRQPRRSLEPVSSPGEQPGHPLSMNSDDEMDQVEFKVFDPSPMEVEKKQPTVFMPLKTAFKSNLTASLRALRSAARSLSSFTATSVPPQDLITRSILTIDPGVPFTDERRPPVLEEQPSEAMRRYLNPTTSARLELRTNGVSTTRSYTASIQMQTYKIQRTRSAPPSANRQALVPPVNSPKSPPEFTFPPGPRQREIRENPDFIRVAVMEHLMRKRGKLDNQQEGHARWLLPPRKQSSKVYDIGPDGVPIRWVSTSQDII